MRRTLLLAAVLVAAVPAVASAHATLERSSPARGATVVREPSRVVFGFDESVEGSFGSVRVFDARGARVDRGDAFHPGGAGSRLAVRLRPGLGQGTYTATYRVVSADGHVVSGGSVFSVGRAGAAGPSVEDLLERSGAGPVTSTAFAVARAVQYAALAAAGGGIVLLLFVWPGVAPAGLARRVRAVLLASAAAGAVSALAGVALEAAQAAGVDGWTALRPHLLREVIDTRFGTVWSLAAAAWALVAAAAARRSPERRGGRAARLAVAPLIYLMLVPALSGHPSTQRPTALLFPANALHVAAASVWAGGLLSLLVAVPAATRTLPPAARTRALAQVLPRFSALALAAVAALALTGLVQAYVEVRRLDLVTTTAFGRAVLVKLGLLLALMGLGALHRGRIVPRLLAAAAAGRPPGDLGVTLRRTLRAEVGLLAAVLGVTGALAGYAPATSVSTGPFNATTRIGPQAMQITVDPARVGANEIHVYLTDPRTGAPLDAAKQVTVRAALPAKGIAEMEASARSAGPGHHLAGLVLGVPGTWVVEVAVRVSAFDEYTTSLRVRVR